MDEFIPGVVCGLIIAFLIAMIWAKGDDVRMSYVQEAMVLCNTHQGVDKIEEHYDHKLVAYCEDGVIIEKDNMPL